MTRNLKVLGVALAAIFAFSSMVATAAMAQNGRLTSTGPVTLDITEIAGQVNALTAFGGKTECPGSVLTGHKYNTTPHEGIPSGAETVTLTADYAQEKCVVVEGGTTHKATVTMNGCDYVLHLGTTTGNPDEYKATVDVVCPVGASIIVDVYFSSSNENIKVCEITVGAQTGLSGATVKDPTNEHLEVRGTFKGIKASKSGVCGAGSTTEGEFHANLTVTGTNAAGESTDLSLSHL